jgi:hypothetical protein
MRDEFIITRNGKQFVLFAGLLDAAHRRGLRGIDTHLVQVPNPENGNVAVVKALVDMGEGRTFSGIGDASPENVGRTIAPHVLRMAETRAKARALRDAVNVGATPADELLAAEDATDEAPANSSRSSSSPSRTAGRTPPGSLVRAVPDSAQQKAREEEGTPSQATGEGGGDAATRRSPRGGQKARKSQIDLLQTLAVELRGQNGVQRLEATIGKPLGELTKSEAQEWIERLTPREEIATSH